ncbi:hypothetical protein SMICM17S_10157 [Streptomyces microflavus]
MSAWSAPTWWETGRTAPRRLVRPLGRAPGQPSSAHPHSTTPPGSGSPRATPASSTPATRWLRSAFEVPEGATRARLVLTADDGYTAHLDGTEVASAAADHAADAWRRPSLTDVTQQLAPGRRTFAISATNGVAARPDSSGSWS